MLNRDISALISALHCARNKYGHLTSAVATLSFGTRAADNVAGGSATLWQRRRRDRFGSPAGWRRKVGAWIQFRMPDGLMASRREVLGKARRTELEPCPCDAVLA